MRRRRARSAAPPRWSARRSQARATLRCRKCAPVPEEIRRTADLLERRLAISILYASRSGAVRFNEFLQALGPVPPGTLAARLSELVEAGLLERRVVDARPPRAEYLLTRRGREIASLVDALGRVARV